MPTTTSEQIIEALRPVEDPELRRSIVDLGMVRSAVLDDNGVAAVQIALTVAGCPLRNEITSRVTAAVAPLPGVSKVALDFTVMTDQEREAVRMLVHGNPGQYRALTDGVCELKIDVGPGYRVYYSERLGVLIVLLAGGDKSSQAKDIKTAIALAKGL